MFGLLNKPAGLFSDPADVGGLYSGNDRASQHFEWT
jgi:hypothetical protein